MSYTHRPTGEPAMTEFTKTKMHFTLALLGTLFAIHPFVDQPEVKNAGFTYLEVDLTVYRVYALIGGLLAFTVYCYALSLRSERPASWPERIGNYSYSLAAMILPLYGGLYLVHLLAEQLEDRGWARAVRFVPPIGGALWLLVSIVFAWRLRNRLSEQDRRTKLEQLTEREIAALNRSPEMFDSNHFDLSVIEAWKAVEARLRRALLLHGVAHPGDSPQDLINAARRAGLLRDPADKLLHELLQQWRVAIGTEPLSRQAAESALKAARDVLSIIPVHDPKAPAKH
jgi:hypothetical protein